MKKYLRVVERVGLFVMLITLLVSPGLYASEETLPKPEEIIKKNIEARGGIEVLKKIKNKKIVQIRKAVQINMDLKSTIYQERPNNYYVVMDTGIREGANGKIAWDIDPSGRARLLEGNHLSAYLGGTKFDDLDMNYKSMKTEGIEQIDGKECYKVVKTPGSVVYYDKKSFMMAKKTATLGNYTYETYIKEYQKINGILFPLKEVTFLNGQKYFETTIEKIELNIEMPEGIFDIPEEVKAIMDKK